MCVSLLQAYARVPARLLALSHAKNVGRLQEETVRLRAALKVSQKEAERADKLEDDLATREVCCYAIVGHMSIVSFLCCYTCGENGKCFTRIYCFQGFRFRPMTLSDR